MVFIPSSSVTALQRMIVVLTVVDNEVVTEDEAVVAGAEVEEEAGGSGDTEISDPQDVKIGRMEVVGTYDRSNSPQVARAIPQSLSEVHEGEGGGGKRNRPKMQRASQLTHQVTEH